MSGCPENSDSINLVECILCVYELKTPYVSRKVFVLQILNPVDCALNYRLESGTHLAILTRHGFFRSRDLKYDLVKKTPPRFSYANRTYARLFFKRNHPADINAQ